MKRVFFTIVLTKIFFKMETKNFLESVADLCRVEVSEIAHLSQAELVNDFILPKGVEPTGQDTRGWRISPQFMQFMADYGSYCVAENRATGELLMEIAMQRLSKGAIVRELHGEKAYREAQKPFKITDEDDEATKKQKREGYAAFHIQYLEDNADNLYAPYNPWFALPEEYRKYSNWYDQPGLMSQDCWDFFRANIYWCMTELSNPVWKGHACKLCVGLIQHVTSDGEELGGYMWSEDLVNEPLKAVYLFAEDCACRVLGIQKVAQILLPTWRSHKPFYKKYEWEIDFPALFKDWGEDEPGLDVEKEGERYYGKWQRRFLKLFWQYKSHVEAKVKAEMLA